MSTVLLQELHQEVRRLYIAGSDLAAGDFRLKRLLPQFQQLGERAAVFKRLGEGISSLLEPAGGQEPAPAIQLQELTLLLESVLYTQGITAPDGTPGALQTRSFSLETKLPYRKLAAVRQALTTTGGGRHEIVVDAFNEGMFRDLRLLPLAIAALSDPYSEIADFAMTKILPSYGPAIVNYLLETFNPEGGRSEVRKLKVIGKVGGDGLLGEIFSAAETGSDDIRVAAIECLGGHEEYISALLGYTTDKKKVIREAAFAALAAGGSLQGGERLIEAFTAKKDRALVADALAKWPSAELGARLSALFMEELRGAPQEKGDKKVTESVWNGIEPFLTALYEERNPQLDEIYSYVIREYHRFSSLGWMRLIDRAAMYKELASSEPALAELQELEKLNSRYSPNYFRSAQQLLTPAELYKEFGGMLMNNPNSKQIKHAAERAQQLLDTIGQQIVNVERVVYEASWELSGEREYYTHEMLSAETIAAKWDPQWLDWFIERNSLDLACAFARPGHDGVRSYLLNKLQEQNKRRSHDAISHIFMGLERSGMAEAQRQELLIDVLENDKSFNPYMFDYYLLKQMLRFPPDYISRIEALLPKYRYESHRQLEYLIIHLRSKL